MGCARQHCLLGQQVPSQVTWRSPLLHDGLSECKPRNQVSGLLASTCAHSAALCDPQAVNPASFLTSTVQAARRQAAPVTPGPPSELKSPPDTTARDSGPAEAAPASCCWYPSWSGPVSRPAAGGPCCTLARLLCRCCAACHPSNMGVKWPEPAAGPAVPAVQAGQQMRQQSTCAGFIQHPLLSWAPGQGTCEPSTYETSPTR